MAVDEYFFQSLTDEPRTYVRFYQWERPTASLGCSQRVEKAIDLDFCRKNGIDVVRRITGGKLVLHHKEITYSVCSSDSQTFATTLSGSYKVISRALMRGLEKMGLQPSLAEKAPRSYVKGNLPCFSHPAADEIEVNQRKIIGSAQKRAGTKFLQHGSIPLAHNKDLLKSVSRLKANPVEINMTSLSEVLGKPIGFEWAVEKLVAGFEEFFRICFISFKFCRNDLDMILSFQKKKYDNQGWIIRGQALE
jgi:lipoate-protein ligase A